MNNYSFVLEAMMDFADSFNEDIELELVRKIETRLTAADVLVAAFEAVESGHAPDSQRKEALREYHQKID